MITTLVYRDFRLAGVNPPAGDLAALRQEPNVLVWVDLSAPSAEEGKAVLEEAFGLHPLVVEDCLGEAVLPKLEYYDDYLHVIVHAVDYSKTEKFVTTGLDLVLGKNYLLTIHREPLRPVQAVLERYSRGGILVRGADRFAHSVLDLIVDAYKPAVEELGGDLQDVESDVLKGVKGSELFPRVVSLRKDLAMMRQIVRPQREITEVLAQGKGRFFRASMLPYMRDLADDLSGIEHQAISWADQLLIDFRVYLNKSSHEASEGIRVITALTALTLPPLLIGAWYGMNFKGMKELGWWGSYPVVGGVTFLCFLGMVVFMKRRKWL